jgi:PAS domain S-box-containing protein
LHDDEGKLRGFSVVAQDITEKKEAERNLEEAEDRLRTLVEHVSAITYTGEVGGDHALAYVSRQIEAVLGYSPGEVMADPDHWTKMLHPYGRSWVLAEERRTGEPLALEYRMFARNGRVVWLRDEATLVRDEEGHPLHWQGFMLDVTKRKKAEERLRESEEMYRNVVEQAAENIFLMDPYTKHILQANASFHHSLGYEVAELRRLTLYDIVAHDQKSIDRNVQRVLDEGRLSIGERRYRCKDGSLINVEVSAGAIAYGGRPALCVAYDVLAQTAAAAHQHLQAFARHNTPGSARGQEELDEALKLVREVVGEAREVIHDLRPTVLDDFGLAAVRLQVQMLRSEGLEVGLEEAVGDERLPPEVETTLFRVAQEALTNVRKHARASTVHVVLDRSGRAVRLMVRDEGRGFRPDEARRSNGPGERVGLSGMRERLSLLGGRFELQSEPGSGTTVTAEVEVPTNREDSDDAG